MKSILKVGMKYNGFNFLDDHNFDKIKSGIEYYELHGKLIRGNCYRLRNYDAVNENLCRRFSTAFLKSDYKGMRNGFLSYETILLEGGYITNHYDGLFIALRQYFNLSYELHNENGAAEIHYGKRGKRKRGPLYCLRGKGMSKSEWQAEMLTKLYW